MSFPVMRYYSAEADATGGPRLGISPNRWGRTFWNTLHYVSLGYPETNPSPEVREAAYSMLVSLQYLLPCKTCREHLANVFRTDMPLGPEVFASRQALGTYIVNLRDLVKRKHVCPGCKSLKQHSFPNDVHATLFEPSPLVRALRWATVAAVIVWLGMSLRSSLRHTARTAPPSQSSGSGKPTPAAWARRLAASRTPLGRTRPPSRPTTTVTTSSTWQPRR